MKRFRFGQHIAALVMLTVVPHMACQPAGEERAAPKSETGIAALPDAAELSGWEMVSEPLTFGPDNLWDYINGQAESYLGYGFQRVDTAEYSRESGPPAVVVEIYRMASPEDAFGIFAAERSPDDQQIEIGTGGYLGPNVLNFWQGKNYIKLTSFAEGAEIENALTALAREISAWSPAGSGGLEIFSYFPEDGKIEASARYISQSFLGQDYLDGAYRVDYERSGDGVSQLFLIPFDSNDDARAALARYAEFLESQGRSIELVEGESPVLVAEAGRTQVAFVTDEFLGGGLDLSSSQFGRELAEEFGRRISTSR